jgi:hypothetical protein
MFLLCFAGIYGIAFAANYVTGGVLALAKHGRYYIPFGPMLFLGIAGLFSVNENVQRLMRGAAIVSFVLVNVYYSYGLYTTYYTYCGYESYVGGKCTLPIYKNLEKGSAITGIANGEQASQTFINQCGNLEMVDVFVESTPSGSDSSLRFALLDDQGQVLASREFPVSEVTGGEYLSLPVELPSGYDNKNFVIQFEALNVPPMEKFRFGVAPGDYYPGQLTAGGTSIKRGDLLIHYVCTTP